MLTLDYYHDTTTIDNTDDFKRRAENNFLSPNNNNTSRWKEEREPFPQIPERVQAELHFSRPDPQSTVSSTISFEVACFRFRPLHHPVAYALSRSSAWSRPACPRQQESVPNVTLIIRRRLAINELIATVRNGNRAHYVPETHAPKHAHTRPVDSNRFCFFFLHTTPLVTF